MFPPFVIAVYESPNWAQCEKLDLKIIQSLLERVHICLNVSMHGSIKETKQNSQMFYSIFADKWMVAFCKI